MPLFSSYSANGAARGCRKSTAKQEAACSITAAASVENTEPEVSGFVAL